MGLPNSMLLTPACKPTETVVLDVDEVEAMCLQARRQQCVRLSGDICLRQKVARYRLLAETGPAPIRLLGDPGRLGVATRSTREEQRAESSSCRKSGPPVFYTPIRRNKSWDIDCCGCTG